MAQNLTRLSVNLNAETADALRQVMARRGITGTEAVRRAISVYKYIEEHIDNGYVVRISGDDGVTTELVLL